MKKITALVLTIAMLLLAAACAAPVEAPVITPVPEVTAAPTVTPAPTPTPTPEPTPEPEAAVSVTYEEYSHMFQTKKADGTVFDLLSLSMNWPVLSTVGPNAACERIQAAIDQEAEAFKKNAEKSYAADAEQLFHEMGEDTTMHPWPLEVERTAGVTYQDVQFLSFTYYEYFDLGGAHPSHQVRGYVYDMTTGNALTLNDILAGTPEEVAATVADALMNADPEQVAGYYEDARQIILDNYLDSDAYITCYFDKEGLVISALEYAICPYAAGMPEVTIPYAGNESMFKIELVPEA